MSSPSKYDIVIVGSGMGGLLSAVILAKEGMKVAVLEKNTQIGGCLQTFSLHKKVFDSCVHYIGGLGEGHTLHQIFKYAGIMDKLSLKELDPNGYDHIAFGNDPVEYPMAVGRKNFIEQLIPYFPDERPALEKYISLIEHVADHFPLYHLQNGSVEKKKAVTGWELTETLANITSNPLLQNVLAGANFLYGGVRGRTPFYVHALVTESYMHSVHKVVPGSSQISKFLWKELQQHGGEIIRHAPVTKLAGNGNIIQYAETSDGTRYYADKFIAAIHPALVVDMIDADMLRPAYRKRVTSLEQTKSVYMVNIVLKPRAIPYRSHNIYWHNTPDAFEGIISKQWPASYALYFGEDAANKGFADTISLITYMPYEMVALWQDTHNHTGASAERGAAYEAFKEEFSRKLIAKAEERIPGLSEHILDCAAASPLTFRDYTGSPEGALYGILKDVQLEGRTAISHVSRIPNLLLTGQNINLHGVLGVSLTALLTTSGLIGMDYLLEKIRRS